MFSQVDSIQQHEEARTVQLHPGWLRVAFGDGHYADFHLRWLRHNCDVDRHPQTRERTVCSSDLPDELPVTSAVVRDGALLVRWAWDGRESRYLMSWLREHAYALDRVATPPPPSSLERVELFAKGLDDTTLAERALAIVRREGLVVVRRDPESTIAPESETEALIERLAQQGLTIIGTHFGRIEDLRTDNSTNQNTDQLGYTDAPIQLHTDQPFLDAPPRYQLLQSIRTADQGGENFITDARAALRYLASIDARAAEILCTVPVHFHRKQKNFERLVISPLIARRGDPDFLIRYSYFTVAPYQFPFAEMEEFYRAHDRFARIVRDPANQYQVALKPGDWLLYDNHRMLHARKGFRGARWVRGIYFDPRL